MMSSPRTRAWYVAIMLAVCLSAAPRATAGQGAGPPSRDPAGAMGQPLITNYTPADYGAEAQNWAAVQDFRGVLYVANTSGLLEFDGDRWRLIRLGEDLAARSTAVDAHGRIFVGAYGDFGMLKPDADGQLQFVSLSKRASLSSDTIGDVVTAVSGPQGVIFQSLLGLFICRGETVQVVRPETQFALGFMVRDRFFVRQRDRGLFELKERGQLTLVGGSERYGQDRVFAMLPAADGRILIGSRDAGFALFAPEAAPAKRFQPAPGFKALEQALQGKKAGMADMLPDGRMAFGTIQSGVYICLPDGTIQYQLGKAHGLQDSTVYYVYTDRRGNLVLCLSVGLALVETSSPFSFVTNPQGVSGIGNTAYRVPIGSTTRTFLGTYQGLFVRDGDDGNFRNIPGSQEGWDFLESNGHVLFAHNDGVAEIDTTVLRPILTNEVCLSLTAVKASPAVVLVGTIRGISRLEFRDGGWHSAGQVRGFAQSAYDLTEAPDGSLWLYTQTGNGLFRLRLSDDGSSVVDVRNYTVTDGLPANANFTIARGHDGLLFGTARGVFRLNGAQTRFLPDLRFPDTHADGRRVKLLHEDRAGNVFVLTADDAFYYRRLPDGRYQLAHPALTRLRTFRVAEYVGTLDERSLLVGYQNGFVHVDLEWRSPPVPTFRPLVREVQMPDRHLYAGSGNAPAAVAAPDAPSLRLPYRANSARFVVSTPFYQGASLTEFQYLLDGFDAQWSPWLHQTIREYTNLQEGQYRFHVRARNVLGEVSAENTVAFVVEPPWYRTWPALLGFAVGGVLLTYAAARLYGRRLRAETARLERLVAEKTAELREASLSDPLTGLRNRRFVSEVVVPEVNGFATSKQMLSQPGGRKHQDLADTVFAFYLCDLDHFKHVNDTHGHEAGDMVLRQLSRLLTSSVREDDSVVRWGGEEFLVILKRTERAYVDTFAERLRSAAATTPFRISDDGRPGLALTLSIGYVTFPFYDANPKLLTFEQMVQMADLGLYYAKQHGRNRAVRLEPGPAAVPADRVDALLTNLDAAIENGYVRIKG